MHIKYITNVRIPTVRAAGYAIMKMCSEFAKAGVKTELFVPSKGSIKNEQNPFEFYGLEKNFEIKKISSLDLLGLTERFGKIFYWLDILSFLLSLKSQIKFDHDDVLYTRDFITTSFLSKRSPIILELHSIPRSKFLFNLSLKKAGLFVVLNSNIKNILLSSGISSEKILIAPSGVDLNEFNNISNNFKIKGISDGDFVYGYVGALKTMGMEKGVELGLKTLAELPSDYKFLIVGGEREDVEYYKSISLSLGISDRVIFIGNVPHNEIYKYINQCNILIAPYPENEHYSFFMSPLKIFEYMASKKPIIATNLPSIQEVLTDGENALLIPPGDPLALVDAIIKLKENPEYGRKIAEKAYQEVVAKYTWKKRVEHILRFICM